MPFNKHKKGLDRARFVIIYLKKLIGIWSKQTLLISTSMGGKKRIEEKRIRWFLKFSNLLLVVFHQPHGNYSYQQLSRNCYSFVCHQMNMRLSIQINKASLCNNILGWVFFLEYFLISKVDEASVIWKHTLFIVLLCSMIMMINLPQV